MLKNNPNIDYQLKREELLKERIFLKEGNEKVKILFEENNEQNNINEEKEEDKDL